MKDYKNGKIYEIVCNKTGKRYVGSTAYAYLKDRIKLHEYDLHRWQKNPGGCYCTSKYVMEQEQYTSHLIEAFPCTTQKELSIREGFYIRRYKKEYGELCVNSKIAGQTVEEWRQSERGKTAQKRSHLKHREKRLQEQKEYYAKNKATQLGKQKEYREKHRHDLRDYKKAVYAWHKSCDFLSKINISPEIAK